MSDQFNKKKEVKKSESLWLYISDLSLVMLLFLYPVGQHDGDEKRDFDHFKQGFEPDVIEEASHDSMFNKTAKQITEVIKKKENR